MSKEKADETDTAEGTSREGSDTAPAEEPTLTADKDPHDAKPESEPTPSPSEPPEGGDGKVAANGTETTETGGIYRKFDSSEAEKLEEPCDNEVSEDGTPGEKKIEALEIGTDESFDEENADMEGLLGGDSQTEKQLKSKRRQMICGCLAKPEKVGNMYIFLPTVFSRYGWGIAGPHWFGPFCVLFLILLASHYFIKISLSKIGPITAAICILFTCLCIYHLGNCSYRDPGVVKLQPGSNQPQQGVEDQRLQFRWCDLCQCFQPPDGAHCSDCNACMAGFDHHCVWMGTCIGRKNYKQFVLFNVTWLLYLIYSIIWVSVAGPLIFGHHHENH